LHPLRYSRARTTHRRGIHHVGAGALCSFVFWAVFALVVLIVLSGTFFTVEQQSRAIIERFGRYVRTAPPGLNVKIP